MLVWNQIRITSLPLTHGLIMRLECVCYVSLGITPCGSCIIEKRVPLRAGNAITKFSNRLVSACL